MFYYLFFTGENRVDENRIINRLQIDMKNNVFCLPAVG